MKIENIQVGDWIQAKESEQLWGKYVVKKGICYEVLKVDSDDGTVKISVGGENGEWWVVPDNFRQPKVKTKSISSLKELVDTKAVKLRDELIAMYPLEDK